MSAKSAMNVYANSMRLHAWAFAPALAMLCLSGVSAAHAQNMPVQASPSMIAVSPSYVSPGPQAMMGGAKAPNQEAEAAPVYRDPTKTVTIDDLSEVYTKRSEQDFFRKNGFTDKKPLPLAKASVAKPPPVIVSMRVLTLYASPKAAFGEVSVSGAVMRVVAGQKITPFIVVSEVTDKKLVLSQIPASAARCVNKPRSRGCKTQVKPAIHSLGVGDSHSWQL